MKVIVLITFTFTLLSCTNTDNENIEQAGKEGNAKQTESVMENFDTSQLTKTAEMLDEELYWSIVDKSLKNTSDQESQERFLINEIGKLTPKQMIGFRLRTDKLLNDTYTSEMWCAAYIINGGCSDDGFDYFRNWLISRGKETYNHAKENPDNLISEVGKGHEEYEFESFGYVALEAFKRKTGQDIYSYIDDGNFNTSEGKYSPIKFTWEEENPASMKKICPRLFEKLWRH